MSPFKKDYEKSDLVMGLFAIDFSNCHLLMRKMKVGLSVLQSPSCDKIQTHILTKWCFSVILCIPVFWWFLVVVVLLFYIHGKHLRSCRDGQLT